MEDIEDVARCFRLLSLQLNFIYWKLLLKPFHLPMVSRSNTLPLSWLKLETKHLYSLKLKRFNIVIWKGECLTRHHDDICS